MTIKDNNQIRNYINNVCSQVKNKRVHKEIKSELIAHLEEKTNEYIGAGDNEDEALKSAINEMGSAVHVGSELNIIHKCNPEWSVIILSIILSLVSIAILVLFQLNGAFDQINSHNILQRNNIYIIIGIFALLGACFIDYRKIKVCSKYIYAIAILGLSITVFGGFQAVNGVKQWLPIGPLSLDMGYLAPMLLIIALSGIYDNYKWSNNKIRTINGILLGIIPLVLIALTNSMVNFIIYAVSVILLLYLSKIDKKTLLIFIVIEALIMILTGVGFESKLNFINNNNIDGYENIYNQLKTMRDSSVLIGQATNFNKNIIPEFYTDYILSYAIYNFGWIIGIIIITLLGALITRIIKIALSVRNSYGKSLVLGIVSIISIQSVWNIALNLGLTISNTAPLPFISYGGTSMIINMLIIGIIINVYKGRSISKVKLI